MISKLLPAAAIAIALSALLAVPAGADDTPKQTPAATGQPAMTDLGAQVLAYHTDVMLTKALKEPCIPPADRPGKVAEAQAAINTIETWNNARFAKHKPGDEAQAAEIRRINLIARELRLKLEALKVHPPCVIQPGPAPKTTPAPPAPPAPPTPPPGAGPPKVPLAPGEVPTREDNGLKSDQGKLTPAAEELMRCATPEEIAEIKRLQESIASMLRQSEDLKKELADSQTPASKARDDYHNKEKAGVYDAVPEQRTADLEKIGNLDREEQKAQERIQVQRGTLDQRIRDADQEIDDLIDRMNGRDCPPPGATPQPSPPEPPPAKPEKTGWFEDILGHVSIGVGVGGGSGGGHGDHTDHPDHPDHPDGGSTPAPHD